MTPQEQFDYKRRWLPDAWVVTVNQDWDWIGKDWCRKNLERHQWSFKKYANPDDSHNFLFESEDNARQFKLYYEQN